MAVDIFLSYFFKTCNSSGHCDVQVIRPRLTEMKKYYWFMKGMALIFFMLMLNLTGNSQNCSLKRINSYDDTLALLIDYTNHLFIDAKPGLKNKLITFYAEGELSDTCYLFLVPDSQMEFTSDGDYISQFVHRSMIDKHPTVRWIEVSKLVADDNFYKFTITVNRKIRGATQTLKTVNYKVKCKQEGKGYQFLRKL
jgi:hypothetical protein